MRIVVLAVLAALLPLTATANPGAAKTQTVWILTTDGRSLEGTTEDAAISVSIDRETHEVPLHNLLSINTGTPPSEYESAHIQADLKAVQGTDHRGMEAAVAELTDMGLPVMSPLLAAYKDTDAHEPNPLYRLFARIVPGYADQADRNLDLIRTADGVTLRGHTHLPELAIKTSDGKAITVAGPAIRRIAVRRSSIDRSFSVDALHHCTQIEFLDSGVRMDDRSHVEAHAQGYVRLSFDIDGWATDPDGIKVPGPNYKTTDVDGFAFGALVGRVGPAGARWKAGKSLKKAGLGSGRLYFAVNDNGHWQNNLGSFKVRIHVSDAYDLGDPR